MSEFLNRVNWIDIFALILLIRICYVSTRIGVGKQILPLILLTLILIISLKYYAEIGSLFVDRFKFEAAISNFFSFLFILIILGVVYYALSRVTGFFLSIGEDTVSNIERIGGVVVGFLRSVFIIGLILIGFLLMPVRFFEQSVKNSYSSAFFINVNLKIYASVANLVFRRQSISYKDTLSKLLSEKDHYYLRGVDPKTKSRFFKERY